VHGHTFSILGLPVAASVRRIAGPGPQTALVRAILLVFLPFSAGYYLSYFYRSTNAVIAPQLVSEVGLNAGDLGFLTSMYFLTFAAFQLPLGILLDRYGPRRVQSCLLLAAAAGALLFSFGDDIVTLAVGRGLIGLGVAGCLMAAIKAGTIWFDTRHWPVVNGCLLAVGGLGAVSATAPLEAALGVVGWRHIFVALACATVLVSGLILVVVPESRTAVVRSGLVQQVRELGRIYTDRVFWRLAPLTVAGMSANLAIQGLWAGPWLRDVAGFGRDGVALYLLALALALTVGSVLLGVAASWAERRGFPLLSFFVVFSIAFLLVQTVILTGVVPQALWTWIGFGLVANIAMATIAYLTRYFPPEQSGRVITAMNMLIFSGVFLTQYLIGEVIDLWPKDADGGYHPQAYMAAFGAVAVAQLASLLWFVLRRPQDDGSRQEPVI